VPRFTNKVAIVSGAASGIGLATANRLLAEGANVIFADIDEQKLETCSGINHENSYHITVDVSKPEDCQSMVDFAIQKFGRLDIAINNAGIGSIPNPRFEDTDIDEWQRIININLNGVFYAMRSQIAVMRAQGSGAIVNTASVASVLAARGMPAYIAAKHGVAGLTKAAALDVADTGIRINAVCPGFVDTSLTSAVVNDPELCAAIKQIIPMNKIASADEIAASILFLASADASYATGSLLVLDGGTSII